MNNKTIWHYAKILAGILLTTMLTSSIPLFNVQSDCSSSGKQTVVKWKNLYYRPCKHSWNGFCLWPIRRKHYTYKITVTEGNPIRDETGKVIPIASGQRKKWEVYDSTEWNALENFPRKKNRYQDYEPIADNEYIVIVETRYVLFHNVETTLQLCTQKNDLQ